MSYASLFRHFRKYYDDTPLNYLLRQRLQRACELFEQQPGIAVSEVAFRCGFTDSAYFSRKFHEYYHMPPSAWRTLNAGK
jgi:AraC family L-rhamnose operon regulatory protein RhaS